jgi:hypothetical protein
MKHRLLLWSLGAAVLLYFLGFLSGFFLQNQIFQQSQQELAKIREEFLQNRRSLENIQLMQSFLDTYGEELSCHFLTSVLNQMQYSFKYFWDRLPPKLEVYEKYAQITPDYEGLKRDYTLLSLRAWLFSTKLQTRCEKEIKPVLYFYSAKCEECIEQSFVLDKIKREVPQFSAFIVDFNLDEPIVNSLKEVFNITSVPSFVFKNQTYHGFKTSEELKSIISK